MQKLDQDFDVRVFSIADPRNPEAAMSLGYLVGDTWASVFLSG